MKRYTSMVIYGRSGTGKTTLMSSFPKPLLLLDVKDEGTDSISDVEDIFVADCTSYEDFELMYERVRRNPEEYATVAIDTVSQVQSLLIKETMDGKKTRGNKSAGDWGSMTKRDWGDVAAILKEDVIRWRDLAAEGVNVVFIAQDRTFNMGGDDDDDNDNSLQPEIGPQLMPSVVKVLNAAVQVIGNTFIRERIVKKEVGGKQKKISKMEYCLLVGPDPIRISKIRKKRTTEFPSVIVDPSYDDIMAIIKGDK